MPYLASTDMIDWQDPSVLARARQLAVGRSDPVEIAGRCFVWVRDEIRHSLDHGLDPVTCAASEVLRAGHGFCYGKSHLLAALLRANGLPAGICYQRLLTDLGDGSYCLHALNAVRLPGLGWLRVDARGNKPGVDARFEPPREFLAFAASAPGEADLPEVWPEPLPVVLRALQAHRASRALAENLPDVELAGAAG